jgi:hypothetical protein
LLGAIAIAATACAQGDAVQESGPNTYFLSENFSRGLYAGAHDRAVTRASDYCFKKDRRVLVDYVLQSPTNEHGAGSAIVTFHCLSRGDPDLQREK